MEETQSQAIHDEPCHGATANMILNEPTSSYPSLIDVNTFEDLPATTSNPTLTKCQLTKDKLCCGIQVSLPPGKSPHTLYPFSIHDELGDP